MIVQDKMNEKICSFYVSDFHLEMILIPYINKKIEENQKIIIQTEKNLEETIKILMSKMNLKEENKKLILDLGWKPGEKAIKENSNIIIIGRKTYIENENNKIKQSNMTNVNILDCYNLEEVKEEIYNIACKYNKSLNTLGNNNF